MCVCVCVCVFGEGGMIGKKVLCTHRAWTKEQVEKHTCVHKVRGRGGSKNQS